MTKKIGVVWSSQKLKDKMERMIKVCQIHVNMINHIKLNYYVEEFKAPYCKNRS